MINSRTGNNNLMSLRSVSLETFDNATLMNYRESNSSFMCSDNSTYPMQSPNMASVESQECDTWLVHFNVGDKCSLQFTENDACRMHCRESDMCVLYLSRDSELAGRLGGRSDKPNSTIHKYYSVKC